MSSRTILGEDLGARHVFCVVGEAVAIRLLVNEHLIFERDAFDVVKKADRDNMFVILLEPNLT